MIGRTSIRYCDRSSAARDCSSDSEDIEQHQIDIATGELARERESQALLASAAAHHRPRPGESIKRMCRLIEIVYTDTGGPVGATEY